MPTCSAGRSRSTGRKPSRPADQPRSSGFDDPADPIGVRGVEVGNDIRVTADTYPSKGKRIAGTLSTFKEQPGEDRAAWQRKAVDDLDLGNGSVGRRINQIALHGPEHRVLTDAFLRDMLTRIRRNAKTDEEVARKMAKANNGSGASADYINNVLSCYRRKKAAAAKAAASTQ